MKNKRNYKQEIKDWWVENRKVIKTGIICGLAGLGYGFIKGVVGTNKSWLNGLAETWETLNTPCDDGLTKENCDDPEFLELVHMENETA